MAIAAGTVTVGIRVLDESRADMTQYVTRADHQKLREQLREAKAEAAEWEERYEDLLSQVGGTSSP
jgi:hypothetical protein